MTTGHPRLEAIAGRVTSAFQRIHRERMLGLPILSPHLSVEVVDGGTLDGDWIGVLITPWTMNLMLVPGAGSASGSGPVGAARRARLPGGEVEMLEAEDPEIGPFAVCSLYSPMDLFADQATAVATAEAVLDDLMRPECGGVGAPAGTRVRTGVTRRELLRRALGSP